MAKNIILAFIMATVLAFAGCKAAKPSPYIDIQPPNIYTNGQQKTSSGFGDEVYIWEGFEYSTNRIINVQQ